MRAKHLRSSLIFRIGLAPLLLILALSSAQSLFAGGPLYVHNGKPMVWNGPIRYVIDPGPLGTLSSNAVADLVRGAFGTWENVPTATFTSRDEGFLPVDVTSFNWRDYLLIDCESPPSQSPIIFDNTGRIIEDIKGVGSSRTIAGFAGVSCDSAGPIGEVLKEGVENPVFTHGVAVLNGTSSASFGSVLLHELGHLIGLDHTQVNLSLAHNPSYGPSVPIMFWTSVGQDNTLNRDDIAWISELYPQPFFSSNTGRISGQVFRRIGTPFPGANVVTARIDPDFRESLSETVAVVSDYLAKGDGSFELPGLAPGDYVVSIEPLHSETLGRSRIGQYGNLGEGPPIRPFTTFPKDYYNRGGGVWISSSRRSESKDYDHDRGWRNLSTDRSYLKRRCQSIEPNG